MTDLSPAALAVRDAAEKQTDLDFRYAPMIAAAALRAAADQVVPEQSEPPCGEGEPWPQSYQLMADSKWEQRQKTRAELLDIAAELEQSEPVEPTDEELRDLWSWAAGQDHGPWPTQQHCFARAVLQRWGTPANTTNQED